MPDGLVILPPPTRMAQPADEPITVRIAIPRSKPSRQNPDDCAIQGSLFRLTPAKGASSEWVASLPSWRAWQATKGDEFQRALETFLEQVEQLETRPCLPSGGGQRIKEAVLETLPARVDETLCYRYGYRRGEGFINLEPGLRLKMEHAVFRSSGGGSQNLGNFLGTNIAYYQGRRNSRREVEFRLERAESTLKRQASPGAQVQDPTLAVPARGMPHYRLFFLDRFVPKAMQRSAMLIGTRTQLRMTEITRALQAEPEARCPPDAGGPRVVCALFEGPISVSAEIEVMLNDQPVYVPIGALLRGLLSEARKVECRLQTLRIERTFRDRYAPVVFDASSDSVFDLVLLGGDRIFCPPEAGRPPSRVPENY